MKKILSLTFLAMIISIASFALLPLTGTMTTCVGSSSYVFEDSAYGGGTWSSSNLAIATVASVGPATGLVTGVSAGGCVITYTYGGSIVTTTFTVTAATASPITGTTTFCVGTTSTLSDATPGGVWSSGSLGIVTIGASTGVATGVSAGVGTISYTVGGGCPRTTTVNILSSGYVDSISGPMSVCVGSTITLSSMTSGGTWTSGTTTVATINPTTGVVTGVSAGTTIITYTVTTSCGTASTVYPVSVISTPSAGTITGTTTVAIGSTSTLYDAISGGTWSSSNTAIATVGASTGIVSGVSAGTANITYSVTGCGTVAATSTPVIVTAINRISGNVNFAPAGFVFDSLGTLKVWLIKYNPTTHLLEASDSLIYTGIGYTNYYEFLGKPTDSFRVKAAFFPTTFTSFGYLPTYHTSAFYWHSANVIYHISGTANDGQDINMATGTTTTGPGFIAGDVTTGANKGTAGDAPAANMLILALSSTGSVMQQTYTNSAGHYSFSNLPLGTYTIYPEAINYTTTAQTGITLTSGSPSMSAANFGQHTTPKTIRPKNVAVQNITAAETSVFAFPNPSTGKLNIQWNESANEKATLTVADVTGRIVYTSVINLTEGTGATQIDLSSLNNGIYTISVKSANLNYNNKLQIQH